MNRMLLNTCTNITYKAYSENKLQQDYTIYKTQVRKCDWDKGRRTRIVAYV